MLNSKNLLFNLDNQPCIDPVSWPDWIKISFSFDFSPGLPIRLDVFRFLFGEKTIISRLGLNIKIRDISNYPFSTQLSFHIVLLMLLLHLHLPFLLLLILKETLNAAVLLCQQNTLKKSKYDLIEYSKNEYGNFEEDKKILHDLNAGIINILIV